MFIDIFTSTKSVLISLTFHILYIVILPFKFFPLIFKVLFYYLLELTKDVCLTMVLVAIIWVLLAYQYKYNWWQGVPFSNKLSIAISLVGKDGAVCVLLL